MAITLDGTTGITAPTYGGTVASEYHVPVTAFKNRIINGNMAIDQRNAGASKTLVAGASTYVLDRFYVAMNGGTGSVQQVTGTGGFKYAMRMTGAAGITDGYFGQKIESYNISDCASTTVTYTIRASSSVLTSLTWYARFPTAQDNYAGVTLITSGSVAINSTPTNYSFQIALPSGVTNGFELYFAFGGFTSGTLDITGVQLEKGSTATSFDQRAYGTELALCQRYYSVVSGVSCYGYAAGGSNSILTTVSLPVQMRQAPTITITSNGSISPGWTINANGIGATAFGIQTVSNAAGVGGTYNAAISATQEL